MEILRFQHFVRHMACDIKSDKLHNKYIEDYITVSIVIDPEYWYTKTEQCKNRPTPQILKKVCGVF